MTSSTLFITKRTFSYQKAQKTKVAQNHGKPFLVGQIWCFAYIFGELGLFLSKTVIQVHFNKTIAFWRLSWFHANFHDIKHPFHDKKHFFIPKSTKNKSCQNYLKRMFVEPILCFAYIFGELGVFLSKTVSQVQFTKTIVFWRLSWLQGNFHDIKHPFHDKKHFFIPKSTKNKSCSKLSKTDVCRTYFVFRVYFLVNWEFSFPKRLVRFSLPKQ